MTGRAGTGGEPIGERERAGTLQITVNMSDARASRDPAAVLATFALGSCIGVALYDPAARVAGLLHFQLPAAPPDDPARAALRPLMYADTGMAHLLGEMARLGADRRRLRVHLAGGAQILDDASFFDIGRRNHAAVRKVLWREGLLIAGESVGGRDPRTLYLAVADGTLTLRSAGRTAALRP